MQMTELIRVDEGRVERARPNRGASLSPGTSYRSRPGCEPDAGQARRGPALTRHFMTTCGGAGQIPRGPRRIARFCGVEFRMIVAVMRIDLIKYQALGNVY